MGLFMGQEINLLSTLPKTKRNIQERLTTKDLEIIRVSKEYGEMYFDGPRDYGYGGYKYDGRWVPVAKDIIKYFGLKPGHKVLDVGCAKGFLVKDLLCTLPGLEVFGLDISEYAIKNAPDGAFDCVISLDTVHNLPRDRAMAALQEIQRLSQGRAFVRVDSYRTPEQKAIFESWVLTAEFHDFPDGWISLFRDAGYTGDYTWTIIE
jgi:SAM-dependent methyltransferase